MQFAVDGEEVLVNRRAPRYVRIDGEALKVVEEIAAEVKERTGDRVPFSTVARRLIVSGGKSAKMRRQAGLA